MPINLEKIKKEIKQNKGVATDVDQAQDMQNIANEYGVALNNISEYTNKTSVVNLDGSSEGHDMNFIEMILNFLFGIDFEDEEKTHDQKLKDAKFLSEHSTTLEPNKPVEIEKGQDVQIISILENHHFTACILDKKNKSLTLIDPNGQILNTKKFKDCSTKQEIFEKLFGSKQAQQLMDKGYKLCDGNFYEGNSADLQEKTSIFDAVARTTEQKNGNQTVDGACGQVCKIMVKGYLEQRANQGGKIKDMQNFLTNVNHSNKITKSKVMNIKLEDAKKRACIATNAGSRKNSSAIGI